MYAAASRKAPGLRRLGTRIAPGRTHLRPAVDNPATVARVQAADPDLIVSWFWTTRLPEPILRLAPAVGVHPSLLPRHRGPDPCFWAIDAGDEVTGVTAHRLAAEYDTGDILGRRELRIDPSWNGWTLARALDRPSLSLLREIVQLACERATADAHRAGRKRRHGGTVTHRGGPGDRMVVAGRAHRAARARRGSLAWRVDGDR